MKRINQLSIHVINQIAAGEVIERPSSVVKELVENSVDAGATKIEVSISNECRDIRIADNGSGIHPDDIELAFSKHATSKISNENDLWNIHTLGFRGEALASIISIAKVTCTTRTKEFEYGTRVESQNSVVKKSQTGCAIGTIMEVKDLFFNQPVRLKFLKSAKTEFAYIQELMQSIALSHPEVAFVLKNNGNNIISTGQNSDLLTRINEIYSSSFVEFLRPIEKTDELSKLKITGYTSTPAYTRSSKKAIYTFINSRMVKCPILLKAIDLAYKNMLPHGKYPFVVLNLEIPTSDVDVNAHPTKREVRYKNPNQIFNFLYSAIDLALSNRTYSTDKETENINILPFTQTSKESDNAVYITEKNDTATINTERYSAPQIFPVKESQSPVPQKSFKIELEPQTEDSRDYNIIGQYYNTYILIETKAGLEIVDQHIADERYIYEKLKSNKNNASQLLLISDILNLETSEVELLMQAKDKLMSFGYQIEKISATQIIFRKVPQIIAHIKPVDIVAELLVNIKGNLDSLEEKILITTSCKAAVKAGEHLNLWQMEELIKNWKKTKHPYTCPHGRPISKTLSNKEVAAFFNRNA
ncbi:MAG: DNA mismatch repair endonuclease MutL [Candidatus Gastranaerophilales bacterium]|nr:DNA mismatch repair endonuclease MutL [Candidatus Gastranaerophilales bacterium]